MLARFAFARALLFWLILIFVGLLVAPATAQEAPDPHKEQVRLNDRALEAMNERNFVRAASLLEEALHLGELNVIYLNLGRTYHHMGRCKDAAEALKKVGSAPAVSSPAPEFINAKSREYLDDVRGSCQADTTGEQAGADPKTAQGEEPSQRPPPPRADTSQTTWGWVALGTGAGAAAVAGVLKWQASGLRADIDSADADSDGFADDLSRRQALAKQDDANFYDTLALSGAIVAGALVGTGLYMILTAPTDQATLAVTPGPDSLSVSATLWF